MFKAWWRTPHEIQSIPGSIDVCQNKNSKHCVKQAYSDNNATRQLPYDNGDRNNMCNVQQQEMCIACHAIEAPCNACVVTEGFTAVG